MGSEIIVLFLIKISISLKLTRKKVENITNCASLSFVKFCVRTKFASYAGKFLILNIKNL